MQHGCDSRRVRDNIRRRINFIAASSHHHTLLRKPDDGTTPRIATFTAEHRPGRNSERSRAAMTWASHAFVVISSTTSSPRTNGPSTTRCSEVRFGRGSSAATSVAPQSAQTEIPSRYSLRHTGHHIVATIRRYARYLSTGETSAVLPGVPYPGVWSPNVVPPDRPHRRRCVQHTKSSTGESAGNVVRLRAGRIRVAIPRADAPPSVSQLSPTISALAGSRPSFEHADSKSRGSGLLAPCSHERSNASTSPLNS